MSGAQNWQLISPNNAPIGGAVNYEGGAGAIQFRDGLDASRVMAGRMPQAQYPSGYLGVVNSRREQRTMQQAVKGLERKQYDRGHHVERLDNNAHFWPEGMGLDARLRAPMHVDAQGLMAVKRPVPVGTTTERLQIWKGAQVVDSFYRPNWT